MWQESRTAAKPNLISLLHDIVLLKPRFSKNDNLDMLWLKNSTCALNIWRKRLVNEELREMPETAGFTMLLLFNSSTVQM